MELLQTFGAIGLAYAIIGNRWNAFSISFAVVVCGVIVLSILTAVLTPSVTHCSMLFLTVYLTVLSIRL